MSIPDPIVIDIRSKFSINNIYIEKHNFQVLEFIHLNKILKMGKEDFIKEYPNLDLN